MHMNTYELLAQVNWPDGFKDNKGTLTFTKSLGEDIENLSLGTVTSAAVLAHADKIQLRVRTTTNGQEIFPIIDAEWSLDASGQNAQLQKFVRNEEAQVLDDTAAIESFQDQVNALGVRPKFQGFGLRQTTAAVPTTFKFDI